VRAVARRLGHAAGVTGRLASSALAVVAALLVTVCAGCGGSGPSAEELVADTVAKTGAIQSFHLAIDTEQTDVSNSGLSLTFVDGDVQVPDRLEGKVGGKFLGLAISTDLIVVGDDYYLRVPFSGWRKIDVSTLPSAFFDPEHGILAVIQGASGLKRDGSEEVAGVDTYRVTGTVKAEDLKTLLNNAEGDQELRLDVWIGKDDKLVHRLRLTGPIEPREDEDAVRNVELSKFDEPVHVEPPKT
jgi:lipoprotein LprG